MREMKALKYITKWFEPPHIYKGLFLLPKLSLDTYNLFTHRVAK
jgi:hypothetical protein